MATNNKLSAKKNKDSVKKYTVVLSKNDILDLEFGIQVGHSESFLSDEQYAALHQILTDAAGNDFKV